MNPILKILPPVPVGLVEEQYLKEVSAKPRDGCQAFGIRLSSDDFLRNSENQIILVYVKEKDIRRLNTKSICKRRPGFIPLSDDYPHHPYLSDARTLSRWANAVQSFVKNAIPRGTDHWQASDPDVLRRKKWLEKRKAATDLDMDHPLLRDL